MGKPLLGSLLLLLVLCAVVADLHKRSRKGIPDPKTTGITTQTLSSKCRIGASVQEITSSLIPDPGSAEPTVELEKSVNPWLWIAERPLPDGEKPPLRKPLQGRFHVRALLFFDAKSALAVLSVDLPLLRKDHLAALHQQLLQDHGLAPASILAFASGFPADITVPPESLAMAATRCLHSARQAGKEADVALIEAVETGFPVNDTRLRGSEAGALDLAPLCGPVAGGKQYDVGAAVARFLGSLSPDTLHPAPGSFLARPLPPPPFRMVLFRARDNGRYQGALVLAPIPPIVLPSPAFNRITPDYVFPLCRELEKKLECPCLFIRTPCADRMPVLEDATFSNVQRYGGRVASALLTQARKARFAETGRVRAYGLVIRLPLKPWAVKNDSELALLHERYRREFQEVRSTSLDLPLKRELMDRSLTALYLLRHRTRFGLDEALSIKAIALEKGPLLLALPGNCGSSLEEKIGAQSGGTRHLIVSDLDGYISPVVPEERSDGGHRPNLSVYTPDAESRLAARSLEFLRAVRPGQPR